MVSWSYLSVATWRKTSSGVFGRVCYYSYSRVLTFLQNFGQFRMYRITDPDQQFPTHFELGFGAHLGQ